MKWMAILLATTTLPLVAQWLKYPTLGVPRTPEGKPDLMAPAPRTSNGKPDFSGVWITGNPVPCDPAKGLDLLDCDAELPIAKEAIDIGRSLAGGLPYQTWAAALVKQRIENEGKDDPHVRCLPLTVPRSYGLPHLQKVVQTPGLLLILTEWNAGYRQIFLDGRPLPVDPQPSWNGYSSGKWEGDTLHLARLERRPADRGGQIDRTIPAPELREAGNRTHRGRSESLHQALGRDVQASHHARYGTTGRDLFGERKELSTLARQMSNELKWVTADRLAEARNRVTAFCATGFSTRAHSDSSPRHRASFGAWLTVNSPMFLLK